MPDPSIKILLGVKLGLYWQRIPQSILFHDASSGGVDGFACALQLARARVVKRMVPRERERERERVGTYTYDMIHKSEIMSFKKRVCSCVIQTPKQNKHTT